MIFNVSNHLFWRAQRDDSNRKDMSKTRLEIKSDVVDDVANDVANRDQS